jgi:hypothetical protein
MKQYREGIYVVSTNDGKWKNDFLSVIAVYGTTRQRAFSRGYVPNPEKVLEPFWKEDKYNLLVGQIRSFREGNPDVPLIFEEIDPEMSGIVSEMDLETSPKITGRIPIEVQAELERRLQ